MPQRNAADLLRHARAAAGLSQRQLARRGRTAQSVVARIERGLTSPGWDTLTRLLAALGFAMRIRLEAGPTHRSHMLDDVTRILRLTPEARLAELHNASRFVIEARRA